MRINSEPVKELSRIETVMYRLAGIPKVGKYKVEPLRYRAKLEEIYSKLPKEDIETLIELKSFYL